MLLERYPVHSACAALCIGLALPNLARVSRPLLVAVALGTMNVVGGFVVTDRMLGMFKGRRRPDEPE